MQKVDTALIAALTLFLKDESERESGDNEGERVFRAGL